MPDPAYFLQLFDYNEWANARLLEAAAALSPEKLKYDHGQGWGSIKDTLIHMMAADWIWFSRWQGSSPGSLLNPVDFPELSDIRTYWANLTHNLRTFVVAQTPESLERTVTYTNTKGKAYSLKLWQLMAHLANHGTHHRGELAAMFAMLAAPHPEDDWLLYFLARSGQIKDR